VGLSQWFGNSNLCSIRRICGFDNELFAVCFSWFPSNVDADSVGFMYCTNHYNCPYYNRAWCNCACSNSSGDGSWINYDFNSIRCSMLNKRHDRYLPIRSGYGHVGVYSFGNINGTNNAKYGYINEVMR
jgi:hypothetical protein